VTGGKLHLCLACRDVHPDSAGGLARATCELAVALAREGHEVRLLTNRSGEEVPDLPGVSVTRLAWPRLTGRFAEAAHATAPQHLMHAAAVYREVRRVHQQVRPVDAVLAPLWRSEGAVCALDDRIPTIVSCMTSVQTMTEIDPNCLLIPDIEERVALERETLRRCRYLHGLTRAVLTKTIRDHALDPQATVVIGRGLADRRPPTGAQVAPNGSPKVLFVGRLEHRKGVDILLAAARELIDAQVDVNFTLAGPSIGAGYREGFEDAAWQHPRLREAVRFTGEVSDAELFRLYSEADVVCAPSRYESHGIVLVEAMMFGKAIVTCAVGGIGEVTTADHDALLVAPDDVGALAGALRRLLADPDLRRRLGEAARNTYEQRFEMQTVARRMQSFIEEVGVLNRPHAAVAEKVSPRLEELCAAVLGLNPTTASEASAELLNPPAASMAADRGGLINERGGYSQRSAAEARFQQLGKAIASAQDEVARLKLELLSRNEELTVLRQCHETLIRIEQGGWWRLRARILPVLRVAGRWRGRVGRSGRSGRTGRTGRSDRDRRDPPTMTGPVSVAAVGDELNHRGKVEV
jgi:glycosyltransferase involved in cell wall biosynthesis